MKDERQHAGTQAVSVRRNDTVASTGFEVPKYTTSQYVAAQEEVRFNIIASIRDNVRRLAPERLDELIADLDGAARTGDIEYIADTITNWATGGGGYDYVGMPVNKAARELFGKYKGDPDMADVWESIDQTSDE